MKRLHQRRIEGGVTLHGEEGDCGNGQTAQRTRYYEPTPYPQHTITISVRYCGKVLQICAYMECYDVCGRLTQPRVRYLSVRWGDFCSRLGIRLIQPLVFICVRTGLSHRSAATTRYYWAARNAVFWTRFTAALFWRFGPSVELELWNALGWPVFRTCSEHRGSECVQ